MEKRWNCTICGVKMIHIYMILWNLERRKLVIFVRKRRKRLSPATVFGVIVMTLVICGILFYKQSVLQAQSKECINQIKELEKQQKNLEEEKKVLEEFKEYVKTDEYAEEVAREKFGLVYKGEIIFEPESEK